MQKNYLNANLLNQNWDINIFIRKYYYVTLQFLGVVFHGVFFPLDIHTVDQQAHGKDNC